MLDDATKEIGVDKSSLRAVVSAEVGNIFKFGTEKSEKMGAFFADNADVKKPFFLASYGVGITRVMGVIAEKFSDEKGLVWPENIAPAKVYLVRISEEEAVVREADELYKKLTESGVTVLYDDRDERAGAKFADADLLGIPHRIVISKKTCESNQHEYKQRTSETTETFSSQDLIKKLAA